MLILQTLFYSGLAEILTEVRSKTPDNVDDYSILDCEDEEYALYDPNCYLQRIEDNRGQSLASYRNETDTAFSEWGLWSDCVKNVDSNCYGMKQRNRTCLTENCEVDSLTENEDCHIQKRYEWSPWSDCVDSHQSRIRQCRLDLGCKCQDIRQSQGCSPPQRLTIYEICQLIISAFRNGEETPKFEEICTGVNRDVDCRMDVISVKTQAVAKFDLISEANYCQENYPVE